MVCTRCVIVVKSELRRLGWHYNSVELGEAETRENLTTEQLDNLNTALKKTGLELINDKKSILVEKIKTIILEMVYSADEPITVNHSEYLSSRLNYDYTYLANLFSEFKGITIEKFYLANKIEKVKEMLVYNKLSLTEIAYEMHYSSVSHLSNQFKKVTGLTPSHFKMLQVKRKSSLTNV